MKYLETDREFYRKLVRIALPVAAQSVITTGVNLIDTIMLGQLNETALSASSLANQFVHVLVELTLEGDENPTYLGRSFELFVREVIPDDTPAPESGVNVGMVIGLSAGGVAIMAGIAVALILVFKKKKA